MKLGAILIAILAYIFTSQYANNPGEVVLVNKADEMYRDAFFIIFLALALIVWGLSRLKDNSDE